MQKQVLLILTALMPFFGLSRFYNIIQRNCSISSTMISFLIANLISLSIYATSISVSDTISSNTTWTGVDTVKVVGDIYVNNGITLTIAPGVFVEFQGHYKLDVQGTLLAIGTATDIITFTAANHSTGWNRIVFDSTYVANDSSKIVYCKLEYGKATTGGIYDKGRKGGAIYLKHFSKVLIDRCNFSNNYSAWEGGAIYCNYAHIKIQNSSFSDNSAYNDGGAIFFERSESLVINNLIFDNIANSGGGVYVAYGSIYNATFINNTIINNSASYDAGGVRIIQASPSFKNTIIYGNTAPTGSQIDIWYDHPDFYYCNIEGGMAAISGSGTIGAYENCIDADPQFVNSGDHPYDLLDISPCINTGDPAITTNDVGEYDLAGDTRILKGIIDIGAYEGYINPDNFPGTALEFDGTGDYVECGNNSSLTEFNRFTMEVWVKVDNSEQDQKIMGKFKDWDNYYLMGIEAGHHYSQICTNGQTISFYAGNIVSGEWTHLAVTYSKGNGGNNGTCYGYVNGEVVYSKTDVSDNPISVSNPDFPFRMGVAPWDINVYRLNGLLDEASIWNIALDSVQIREQMHLPLAGIETGLVSYFQFNDGAGTTLMDYRGINNGTLHNMTGDDWIDSTIPFGEGVSDTQTETAGTVGFTGTGLSMFFNSQSGASITVTRIDTIPNINPANADTVFDSQYWVVNRFGTGTFNAD